MPGIPSKKNCVAVKICLGLPTRGERFDALVALLGKLDPHILYFNGEEEYTERLKKSGFTVWRVRNSDFDLCFRAEALVVVPQTDAEELHNGCWDTIRFMVVSKRPVYHIMHDCKITIYKGIIKQAHIALNGRMIQNSGASGCEKIMIKCLQSKNKSYRLNAVVGRTVKRNKKLWRIDSVEQQDDDLYVVEASPEVT